MKRRMDHADADRIDLLERHPLLARQFAQGARRDLREFIDVEAESMDAPPLATCIGCACDDLHACIRGCFWIRVNRTLGKGVCSRCAFHVERWDRGDRQSLEALRGRAGVPTP